MNQGLVIVLPLFFFFLIDFTIFVNSLRQRKYSNTAKSFSELAGCIMISQGLTAITYACDWKLMYLPVYVQFLTNLISLTCMTLAPYIWFQYLIITCSDKHRMLTLKWRLVCAVPVFILVLAGIPSQATHWLFYIDTNGVYQPGKYFGLQFLGYVYYLFALFIIAVMLMKKKNMTVVLWRVVLYMAPTAAGIFFNNVVFRGGYTQIGCSYAMFLLYLEQYITEVNENKRLKSLEQLNSRLQEANTDLVDQMSIIGGLSNAFFSVHSINLNTGEWKGIKEIDYFHRLVRNCKEASGVVEAFVTMCVMEEDQSMMHDFMELSTLSDRLSETNSIVEEFHGRISPWEWCRASWVVAIRDENRKPESVLFTVEDITDNVNERKRYEKELLESRASAEAANKAKSDFLFNMSHDIRTPMNAIIGYAALMDKHLGEEDKCRDYLHKIRNSSNFLLSLINNVLEMARIESGKLVLDEKVCEITELLDEIVSVYSDLMEQKRISFVTEFKTEIKYYYGDKVKLSEIFLNILSNAYKYTDEGGTIKLSVTELPGEKEGYIYLKTCVEDTGRGMSQEFIPKIFEEFTREHTSTENKIEGTGLGMPIVKRLVDFMGGTIEVKSELSKGSVFTVTIPHRIAASSNDSESEGAGADLNKLSGKRILLAEDNELNAEIAAEVLNEYGIIVDRAENGLVCVEMLTKAESGFYALVLMDVQMPVLDGYEATKRIRKLGDPSKAGIPVIAMTANAFEEDKRNALAAGMNGHLAKPIEITKLLSVLGENLS